MQEKTPHICESFLEGEHMSKDEVEEGANVSPTSIVLAEQIEFSRTHTYETGNANLISAAVRI